MYRWIGALSLFLSLVQLLAAQTPPAQIIDNANSASFQTAGAWTVSSTSGQWATNYLTDGNTGKGQKSARFTTSVARPGWYAVSLWSLSSPAYSLNTPVDVHHRDGVTRRIVNQRVNGKMWNGIGGYYLNADSYVEILNAGTSGQVLARANASKIRGGREDRNDPRRRFSVYR
ncbi:MAG TPA: hypothetical protein VIT91_15940 [Chthoniobacterales bacterium]